MKQFIETYTFNVSAKTITLGDFNGTTPVVLDRLLLITDVTTGQILYNFASPSVSASISSNNVITLSSLPAGPTNTDNLQIIYYTNHSEPVYQLPITAVKSQPSGTPSYFAGSSGTVTIPSGSNSITIMAHSTTGGTITIGGGGAITIPANGQFYDGATSYPGSISIVFTSTDSYYVSYATP